MAVMGSSIVFPYASFVRFVSPQASTAHLRRRQLLYASGLRKPTQPNGRDYCQAQHLAQIEHADIHVNARIDLYPCLVCLLRRSDQNVLGRRCRGRGIGRSGVEHCLLFPARCTSGVRQRFGEDAWRDTSTTLSPERV